MPLKELCDKWIVSRYQRTIQAVSQSLNDYNLAQTSRMLYQFVWSEFCDWYIELSKIRIMSENGKSSDKQTALSVCDYILGGLLHLLHPIMPFITEELWQNLQKIAKNAKDVQPSLLLSSYPEFKPEYIDTESEIKMGLLMSVIIEVRTIRAEMNVPPGEKISLLLNVSKESTLSLLNEHTGYIQHLCKVKGLEIGSALEKPQKSVAAVVPDIEIFVPLEGLIDLGKEKTRLGKEFKNVESDITRIDQRLSNPDFVNLAPKEEVRKTEQRRKESIQKLERLKEHLSSLESS